MGRIMGERMTAEIEGEFVDEALLAKREDEQ
jgi:hypothetical protein